LETPNNLNKTTPASTAFHNFTLDWTPYTLTTYVDGARIWTMDISNTTTTSTGSNSNSSSNNTHNNNIGSTAMMVFHQPYFILLNLAIGGDYPDIYNPTDITAPFPAQYSIDYIRIYANEWTVLGGTYFSTNTSTTTTANVA
jgi:hypothetical protein